MAGWLMATMPLWPARAMVFADCHEYLPKPLRTLESLKRMAARVEEGKRAEAEAIVARVSALVESAQSQCDAAVSPVDQDRAIYRIQALQADLDNARRMLSAM